jgi:CelD/BcsL family acetyltransferase involved in cellulose biosynthesis
MDFTLHSIFPEDLQNDWNNLLVESITHVPFLRHEYQSTWWQHLGGGEWSTQSPHLSILTARKNDQLIGIAPLFRVRHQERDALLLIGSIEISDFLDLIVCPADLEAFIQGLLSHLLATNEIHWDALDLYNILDSSPSLPALEKAAGSLGLKFSLEKLHHCPYIPLPGDFETYLSGIDKKQRHEIRRKMRRLQESGVPFRWYFTEDPANITSDAQAFLDLMAKDEDKAKFLTPAMCSMMQDAIRCAFENGCLKLAFLEINGQKSAAYMNFDYLNRVWVYNSGLDWSFNEYSPGWVLLGYLLQWANENHRTEFDFMRGDEDYKYRFGAINRYVMRTTISK